MSVYHESIDGEKKEMEEKLVGLERMKNKIKMRDAISGLDWVPLISSNLNSVYYNNGTKELFIKFNSGGTYVYSNVPEIVYARLLDAPSHGKYHSTNIKYNFPYKKLR